MTAATATKAQKAKANRSKIQAKLQSDKWAGEIVTWNAKVPDGTTHSQLVEALQANDLDTEVAHELLPRHAFSRASKAMQDNRLIDVVRDGSKTLTFQLTKKALVADGADGEIQFKKETYLRLDKGTGSIECKDKDLQEMAQALLNKAMVERGTSDVTKVVQRLFELHADLFPLREQGGVYFVPVEHTQFCDKINGFLEKLGGKLNRIPIPAGTAHGDASIEDSMASTIGKLIMEHSQAVDAFDVTTRKDTLERQADRIKTTRSKIETYSHYLRSQATDLLTLVDEANAKLAAKIAAATAETVEGQPVQVRKQQELFGTTVTAVLRWMGLNGWSFPEATKAMAGMGMEVASATIRAQLLAGARGERGEPAQLTKAQAKELTNAAK